MRCAWYIGAWSLPSKLGGEPPFSLDTLHAFPYVTLPQAPVGDWLLVSVKGQFMATLIFDTHAFVKQLTEAGMPEPQAEVLARTHAALIDERLATKEDLQALELRLSNQIKELDARLTNQIKELDARLTNQNKELDTRLNHQIREMESRLKYDLTVRLGSMFVVIAGLIIAVLKLVQ